LKISLLHPSRNRPYKSFATIKKWLELSGNVAVELIVSLDKDDPQLLDYGELFNTIRPRAQVLINENISAVDAINRAAKESTGDILIVVSDDTDCPENWASKIVNACDGRKDFVLKVNDSIQNWIITMPVIDRVYYERFGYIYHPVYKHMFCDTEFTHIADCLKKVIVRHDLEFTHQHYSLLRKKPDELNQRNDATWNEGKAAYVKRVKEKFGMGLNVADISNPEHLTWLKKAGAL